VAFLPTVPFHQTSSNSSQLIRGKAGVGGDFYQAQEQAYREEL